MIRLALAITLAFSLASCYRVASPVSPGTSVRVDITSNQASLVRTQAALQEAVAQALQARLGWTVSPTGRARLALSIAEEEINATGGDRRGIAARWRITIQGAVVFENGGPVLTTTYTGVGNASGLEDEAQALERAAEDAASAIATWLEHGDLGR